MTGAVGHDLRPPTEVAVRPAAPADRPQVLRLMAECLGWHDDERHAALFAWKHDQNPAGPSPTWVATHDGRIVALRALLRWEFRHDGRVVRAVRAVDTATAPERRGQGLFSRLTRTAIEEAAREGVELVFNTPNAQSLPGYLKLGWQVVGRLPIAGRPAGPTGAAAMARAAQPAELWSLPTTAGRPADEVVADVAAVDRLLVDVPVPPGLSTRRTGAHLRWRYGTLLDPSYRVATLGRSVGEGMVVFRLRRRGPARELLLADVLVPGADRRATRRLLGPLLAATGADYALRVGGGRPSGGLVPLPRRGPVLVWRPLGPSATSLGTGPWSLEAGDVELF